MMLLSSLNRLYRFLGSESGNLNQSNELDLILTDWLSAVSSRIEYYLNRTIEKGTYTQYFNTVWNKTVYYPEAIPIDSVTSVKSDSQGLFDGNESTLQSDDYHIGSDSNSVVLLSPEQFEANRGLQIVYVGGLAYHAVNSQMLYVDSNGSMSVGDYVKGATSKAVGIISSAPIGSFVTIENIYGIFESGEVINRTESENGNADGTNYFTISSITRQSLNELYPDLVRAVEVEIRYLKKHKFDFENMSTSKDGNTLRGKGNRYDLQPETKSLLQRYKIEAIL